MCDRDHLECERWSAGISLLDVWAGVSAFTEGFFRQSSVTVKEHAWIEKSSAAAAVLSHFYGTRGAVMTFTIMTGLDGASIPRW